MQFNIRIVFCSRQDLWMEISIVFHKTKHVDIYCYLETQQSRVGSPCVCLAQLAAAAALAIALQLDSMKNGVVSGCSCEVHILLLVYSSVVFGQLLEQVFGQVLLKALE